MSFDIDRCRIKKVWCGNSETIPKTKKKLYSKVGTRHECLRSGFGAGMYTEKREGLSTYSLQRISYVGPKMEKKLIKRGMSTTKELIKEMKKLSSDEKKNILKATLKNTNGTLNTKAYNSVIAYLYDNGVLRLPTCKSM